MFSSDSAPKSYLGVGCLNDKNAVATKKERDTITGTVQVLVGVAEIGIGAVVTAGAAVAIGPAAVGVGLIAAGAMTIGVGIAGALSGRPVSGSDLATATILANPLNALLLGDLMKGGLSFKNAIKFIEAKESIELLGSVLVDPIAPETLLGIAETFRSELMSTDSKPRETLEPAKSVFSLYEKGERPDWSFKSKESRQRIGKISKGSD
jgi:hypothetical protein